MAFGRSNSLSINTGQTNSLFAQQNTATSQPAAGSSLFGTSTAAQTPAGVGSFGNTNTSSTGSGLFGSNTNATQNQPSSGSFGGGVNASQNLGSSAFGRPTTGTSLFGNTNSAQQQNTTSLFGNQPQTSSLFGNPPSNMANSNSMFGAQTGTGQNASNSIFGLSASQPPSLLNASQYRAGQYAPFAGKLSMGQQGAAPATAQGAVKINFETMRSTTRFGDCVEEIQKQLEAVDGMIQAQERFCREIEAFLPKHGADLASIAPDTELVRDKADAVEAALTADAQTVSARRAALEEDANDFQRCRRVVENLRMPAQFHVPSVGAGAGANALTAPGELNGSGHDMDIIGQYFKPKVAEQQKTFNAYVANLAEMEAHLRVIENSAIAQAHQLAARRAGMGGGLHGAGDSVDDDIRDLTDTLRAFESSILGAASLIGECREGVSGLAQGRLGGHSSVERQSRQ